MEENQSPDWLNILLGGVCVLLIACNIALMQKYRKERDFRTHLQKQLEEESQQRQRQIIEAGLIEQAEMEMEVRFWRPALEKAIIQLKNGEYSKVLQTLPPEYDYSSHPIAHYLRAQSFSGLGQEEQAIREFSIYIESVGLTAYARLARAQLYRNQGQNERAIADLQDALEYQPDLKEAQLLLRELESKTKSGE